MERGEIPERYPSVVDGVKNKEILRRGRIEPLDQSREAVRI
jgi:hypothetical protein